MIIISDYLECSFRNNFIDYIYISEKTNLLVKMALQKVKGNIERMFDKNLTDLVRGIRYT